MLAAAAVTTLSTTAQEIGATESVMSPRPTATVLDWPGVAGAKKVCTLRPERHDTGHRPFSELPLELPRHLSSERVYRVLIIPAVRLPSSLVVLALL